MAIVYWHDGYEFGVPEIDSQHEAIFDLAKSFEKSFKKIPLVNAADTISFLETAIGLFDEHFACEEKIMDELEYPFSEHHKLDHFEYRQELAEILNEAQSRRIDGIHDETVSVIENWQEHVVKEDSALFSFRGNPNKTPYTPPGILGCQCEVYNLEGRLITYGNITNVSERGIEIEYRNKAFDITLNEILKVTLFNKDSDFVCFMARMTYKDNDRLILGIGIKVKDSNERAHFRVQTTIAAGMQSDEGNVFSNIKIIDISIGGMLVEAHSGLSKNDIIEIDFEINRMRFKSKCEIVRVLKKFSGMCYYGIKFLNLDKDAKNKLSRCILQEQARNIRKSKELQ